MQATSLAALAPRPGDQYRLRNLRSSMRNVMTRRSQRSSAISTTDSTEEPNHRLHWLPRLDRRVTICKGERRSDHGAPSLHRSESWQHGRGTRGKSRPSPTIRHTRAPQDPLRRPGRTFQRSPPHPRLRSSSSDPYREAQALPPCTDSPALPWLATRDPGRAPGSARQALP